MRRPLISCLIYSWLIAVFWGCAAKSSPPVAVAGLPEPNPRLQKLFRSMVYPKSNDEWAMAVGGAQFVKQDLNISDKDWIEQILVFSLQPVPSGVEGAETWPPYLGVMSYSLKHAITPSDIVIHAAPYVDSSNVKVAGPAAQMIQLCGALQASTPMGGGDIRFDDFHGYLSICFHANREPSWPIIWMMYNRDQEAALNTILSRYFDRIGPFEQRQARRLERMELRRSKDELTLLILSFDLADETEKDNYRKKILVKLEELANSKYWFIRGYVPEVIGEFYSNHIPSGPLKVQWPEETIPLLDRLSKDSNPMVAETGRNWRSLLDEFRRSWMESLEVLQRNQGV